MPFTAPFESTLEVRIEHGRRLLAMLRTERIDLIVDLHGNGMVFVDDPREKGMAAMLHHALGVPLLSHWTETLRIYFKKLDPALVHEALSSPTWFKGVFTRAHLAEMQWMRIPGCLYLPMAANELQYSVDPPAMNWDGPQVFFGGSQQSMYFAHGDGVDSRTQVPGVIATAANADGSASSFLEVYGRYGFGPQPQEGDSWQRRAECVQQYYKSKLFFSAARNLTMRDRFVLLLSRTMGDRCLIVGGDRWKDMYGLQTRGRVPDDEYVNLIRTTPICLDMVNGDNDSGLNLRHFETTAMGGFLLSHDQPELGELFEIGRECESFRNEQELLDKIRFYTTHRAERNRIAEAGQRRTLKCHLLRHRCESAIHWLRKEGAL
jgi:hypothetical protein